MFQNAEPWLITGEQRCCQAGSAQERLSLEQSVHLGGQVDIGSEVELSLLIKSHWS